MLMFYKPPSVLENVIQIPALLHVISDMTDKEKYLLSMHLVYKIDGISYITLKDEYIELFESHCLWY